MANSLRVTRDQGVHVYPVASSGVDELTELSMRSAAQLTGGRYLFLTDDSGVGGEHKEPSIPCYVVTKLDDALLRHEYTLNADPLGGDPQRRLNIRKQELLVDPAFWRKSGNDSPSSGDAS